MRSRAKTEIFSTHKRTHAIPNNIVLEHAIVEYSGLSMSIITYYVKVLN